MFYMNVKMYFECNYFNSPSTST